MLKYPCLVLDHDDTVVQSEATVNHPFFLEFLAQHRPGMTISLHDYISEFFEIGYGDMCRRRFQFTEEDLHLEYVGWKEHIQSNIPAPYPGIDRIIRRQKEEGGILCVVSHSHSDNILRDYDAHFGIRPDAVYGWERPPQHRKPNPWPLEDIMAAYGLEPDEILVVDDMKLACMMAKPLGIKVAFANWDDMGVAELSAEMESLCEFTFKTTKELEKFLFE